MFSRSVDWITATKAASFQEFQQLKVEVVSYFGSSGETKTHGKGAARYEYGVALAEFGSFNWRRSADGTYVDVLVELSGEALRHLRFVAQKADQDICRFLLDLGFDATRFDATVDSEDRRITPALVYRAFELGLFTTRAKPGADGVLRARPHAETVCGSGETKVEGMNFPKKRGGTGYLRCYNKALKSLQDTGSLPCDETGKPIDFLTRLELETRGERAAAALRSVAKKGADGIGDVFASWIDFKDPRSAKNCDRMRDAKRVWWFALVVGEGVGSKVSTTRIPSTPERFQKHIKVNVAPQVAKLKQSGLLDSWLLDLLGKCKPDQKEVYKLRLHREEVLNRQKCNQVAMHRAFKQLREERELALPECLRKKLVC